MIIRHAFEVLYTRLRRDDITLSVQSWFTSRYTSFVWLYI